MPLAPQVGALHDGQKLNPEFALWLMGYPAGWLDTAPLEPMSTSVRPAPIPRSAVARRWRAVSDRPAQPSSRMPTRLQFSEGFIFFNPNYEASVEIADVDAKVIGPRIAGL